jgi:hypothetical protein
MSISTIYSPVAETSYSYVVFHEDFDYPKGSGKWTTSLFPSKFWYQKFLAQLDLMKMDYITEYEPVPSPEDGLAYEESDDWTDEDDDSLESILRDFEGGGCI